MAYTPTYRMILSDLRNSITSGQLKPGDKIPTLKELADRYNCSLGTARRAVEIMLESGELEGRQGLGTFVTKRS